MHVRYVRDQQCHDSQNVSIVLSCGPCHTDSHCALCMLHSHPFSLFSLHHVQSPLRLSRLKPFLFYFYYYSYSSYSIFIFVILILVLLNLITPILPILVLLILIILIFVSINAFTYIMQIRAELIDGDSSVILSLLMRFPDMDDLGPIFRIVSSLRKYGHSFVIYHLSSLLFASSICR